MVSHHTPLGDLLHAAVLLGAGHLGAADGLLAATNTGTPRPPARRDGRRPGE